jgi:hypothetical protein
VERFKLPGWYFRFNVTGSQLACWNRNKLAIYDPASGKQLHNWDWPGVIGVVAFAHDGKHLAVGNANGTIYILRLGWTQSSCNSFPTSRHSHSASAACGASAMTRTIGSVLLGRTWTQRWGQSNRKPSWWLTAVSGQRV